MPVPVIDRLEVVDVEIEHGKGHAAAHRAQIASPRAAFEQRTVAQTGQAVMSGAPGKFRVFGVKPACQP